VSPDAFERDAAETRPAEDVQRGTIFALAVVPLGILVYVILWNVGFAASIVGFGVAWLAVRLYARGAGGTVGRAGAIRITAVTVGTLVLSLFSGIVSDTANYFATASNESPFIAILTPEFWTLFWDAFPTLIGGYLPTILIGLLFGLLGCFSVLRGAFAGAGPARRPMPMDPLFPRDEKRDEKRDEPKA
jgi:hypothetical protein